MPNGSVLSRMLAEAFLSCRWSLEELTAQGHLVLQIPRKPKWFTQFITRIHSRFDAAPPRQQLIEFIEAVSNLRRTSGYLAKLPSPTLLRLPRPTMRPVPGLPALIDLPSLVTPGDLADWLSLSDGELSWFADRYGFRDHAAEGPLRHYRYRCLPKRSGGLRLLEIPKPRLMNIQRQILHGILDQIPPHNAAHAFRPGRSIATYVAPHSGQQVVLHVDLQDFFPATRASRVHALLRTVGYPERVSRLLTALCTHCSRHDAFAGVDGEAFDLRTRQRYRQSHLPQGAPTSPAVANLCAWRLDVRLTALSPRFGAAYTRYADDLLFSGGQQLRRGMTRFRILVLTIALDEGFSIQSRKTRVLLQSQSQRVAGLVLNEHPNPIRQEYDRLKAQLFNCVRHGPASQNREGRANFAQHLRGKIAYLTMINPQRGSKLQALFDQIHWGEPSGSD